MRIVLPSTGTLAYGGVLLRPPTAHDATALSEAVRDPEIARWLPEMPQPCTEAESRRWVEASKAAWQSEEPSHIGFVAINPISSDLIGALELVPLKPTHRVVRLGGWLRRDVRGRGLATTGLALAALWALRSAGFESVQIIINAQNERARKVVERCGFTLRRECAGAVKYTLASNEVERLPVPHDLKFY
ncbi:MAG TPA: GNAT family N-acetyltransferase [Pyrinomonadaceae bacterium]|nr:GNAT family N-acetyltransferase [Pyrinomonadaceae bacterium]